MSWLRHQLRQLSRGEQVIVVVAATFIAVRIILPVWHLWDGYLLHAYPFRESEICLRQRADCQVDRSTTAIQAGSAGLIALGVVLARRTRGK